MTSAFVVVVETESYYVAPAGLTLSMLTRLAWNSPASASQCWDQRHVPHVLLDDSLVWSPGYFKKDEGRCWRPCDPEGEGLNNPPRAFQLGDKAGLQPFIINSLPQFVPSTRLPSRNSYGQVWQSVGYRKGPQSTTTVNTLGAGGFLVSSTPSWCNSKLQAS